VRYYLRTGNATRELNVEEATRHILERGTRSRMLTRMLI
jgi:hypothetical protein